jgi:hypothetical protein
MHATVIVSLPLSLSWRDQNEKIRIFGALCLLGYSTQSVQIFFSVLFTNKYRSGFELIVDHDLTD